MIKLRAMDWALIVAWLFFWVFGGPFLISARDWILVGLGVVCLVTLIYLTVKAIKFHTTEKAK